MVRPSALASRSAQSSATSSERLMPEAKPTRRRAPSRIPVNVSGAAGIMQWISARLRAAA